MRTGVDLLMDFLNVTPHDKVLFLSFILLKTYTTT